MLPPCLVTALATRCSSAAPATVTVAPSRNAEPDGIANSIPDSNRVTNLDSNRDADGITNPDSNCHPDADG